MKKEPETAELLDVSSVRALSRHGDRPLLGAAVATASPIASLIRTLQWHHELSACRRNRAMLNCLNSTEEHARETQRFRRPPRDGAEGGCHASHVRTLLRTGYPQIQHRGLCAHHRKREDSRRDASFWND